MEDKEGKIIGSNNKARENQDERSEDKENIKLANFSRS